MKAGIKSTEFWLAFIALVGGALLASGILIEQPQALRIVEMIVGVLATMGYTASRYGLKKPQPPTAILTVTEE